MQLTDNSKTMGHMQKMNTNEEVEKRSGVHVFQKFLVPDKFKIACMRCVVSRIHMNSTFQKAQDVASKMS